MRQVRRRAWDDVPFAENDEIGIDDAKPLPIWIVLVNLLFFGLLMALLTPFAAFAGASAFFWTLLALYTLFAFFAVSARRPPRPPRTRAIAPEMLPQIIRDEMSVDLALSRGGVQIFKGRLREPAARVFEKLERDLPRSVTPFLQEDEDSETAIILVPRPRVRAGDDERTSAWVHWGLLIATLLTTTWVGALQHAGAGAPPGIESLLLGLPYSLGLLSILGVHELGHYFMAKRHGMNVTPPYFIPVPFGLGTFGAVIKLRSPSESRKTLFDVAVAGPIAGLLAAIPVLFVGLTQSAVVFPGFGVAARGVEVGSSFLFGLLAKLAIGWDLPLNSVIALSPLAFAGWLGLFVTALNLIPIGQLDGGHIAHALFGNRVGEAIATAAMWTLFLLALFVWPGLMMWALIVFFIAGRAMPPLNDITPLDGGRKLLGALAFAILAAIILPFPAAIWGADQLSCPYLR